MINRFFNFLFKFFSLTNLVKIGVIFIVGFSSRVLINLFFEVNVFIEFTHWISVCYYIAFSSFTVWLNQFLDLFPFSLPKVNFKVLNLSYITNAFSTLLYGSSPTNNKIFLGDSLSDNLNNKEVTSKSHEKQILCRNGDDNSNQVRRKKGYEGESSGRNRGLRSAYERDNQRGRSGYNRTSDNNSRNIRSSRNDNPNYISRPVQQGENDVSRSDFLHSNPQNVQQSQNNPLSSQTYQKGRESLIPQTAQLEKFVSNESQNSLGSQSITSTINTTGPNILTIGYKPSTGLTNNIPQEGFVDSNPPVPVSVVPTALTKSVLQFNNPTNDSSVRSSTQGVVGVTDHELPIYNLETRRICLEQRLNTRFLENTDIVSTNEIIIR